MRVVQVFFECLAPTTLDSLQCGMLKEAGLVSAIFVSHANDPLLRLNLLETFGQVRSCVPLTPKYMNAPVPRSLVAEYRVVEDVVQGLDAFLSCQDVDGTALKGELKFLVDAFLSGIEVV